MKRQTNFSSDSRQDDLLKRLKQCVGEIKSTNQTHRFSSNRQPYKQSSRQFFYQNQNQQKKSTSTTSKETYSHLCKDKENQAEFKYHLRQKNIQNNGHTDILNVAKYHFKGVQSRQNNIKSYYTSEKNSFKSFQPLQDVPYLPNTNKQEPFSRQSYTRKKEYSIKNVSDSAKKRISERSCLINQQTENFTSQKSYQRQINKFSNEDEFLERLTQRKRKYLRQNQPQQTEKTLTISKGLKNPMERQNFEIQHNFQPMYSKELNSRQVFNVSSARGSEKFENYEKTTKQNLAREIDFKKAEKTQKLKKITNMNEEINKRIKKIVDTFESYLTNREI